MRYLSLKGCLGFYPSPLIGLLCPLGTDLSLSVIVNLLINKGFNMIYIFDLDGTLADINHRLHYITGEVKDWDSFFTACENDKPIQGVIDVLNALQEDGHRIWIFTGRSDIAHQQTVDWIHEHVTGDIVKLKMRKNGDHQPDFKLKKKWLDELAPHGMESRKMIAGVFEDRNSVCDMWRENGLLCFQVAEGDF